jgi:hypothetical protein
MQPPRPRSEGPEDYACGQIVKTKREEIGGMAHFLSFCTAPGVDYGAHSGKKVFDTIFASCARVALFCGRK